MIIEFKSLILQNNKPSKIEFKAPVKISERDDYTVFEFADPKTKIMNMIEVSNDKINIFTGPMAINLHLNNQVKIEYNAGPKSVYFISLLKKINLSDGGVEFSYSLMNLNQELLGDYEINLKIFSELN